MSGGPSWLRAGLGGPICKGTVGHTRGSPSLNPSCASRGVGGGSLPGLTWRQSYVSWSLQEEMPPSSLSV